MDTVTISMKRKGVSFDAVVDCEVVPDYMPDILAVRPISERTGKPVKADIAPNLDSFELYQVRMAVLAKLGRLSREAYNDYRASLADRD